MQIFKRPLKKVMDNKKGTLKEYSLSLGVNTEINEDRFYKNGKDRNGNDKIFCDVIVCFPDEFDKMSHEHEESQSKIQELEDTIAANKKEIESLQNQLSSIDGKHQKEIKKLKDGNSAKIKELNDALNDKKVESEKIRTKYEKVIGSLKGNYEKEIGKIKTANESHINGLKLYDEEIHMSIIDHKNQIEALTLYDEEKHMKITDHIAEISEANNKMNGIKDMISRKTISHNDKINELDNINLWKYLKGDLKRIKSDLKEDIEDFEMIAEHIELENAAILPDVKMKEADE